MLLATRHLAIKSTFVAHGGKGVERCLQQLMKALREAPLVGAKRSMQPCYRPPLLLLL